MSLGSQALIESRAQSTNQTPQELFDYVEMRKSRKGLPLGHVRTV